MCNSDIEYGQHVNTTSVADSLDTKMKKALETVIQAILRDPNVYRYIGCESKYYESISTAWCAIKGIDPDVLKADLKRFKRGKSDVELKEKLISDLQWGQTCRENPMWDSH